MLWRGRGHWVELVLSTGPGAQVTRWGRALPSVSSAAALAGRTDSAYFYDATTGKLHIKLSGATSDWEEVRVQRL